MKEGHGHGPDGKWNNFKRQVVSDKFIRVPGLPSPEAAYPNKKAILSTPRSTATHRLSTSQISLSLFVSLSILRAPFGYGTLIAKRGTREVYERTTGGENAKLRNCHIERVTRLLCS